MKKKIVFLPLLILSVYSFAQKTTFGIKGGVNSNTFSLNQEGGGMDTKFHLKNVGFHIGGVADINFSENFSIQPQLLLISKGGELTQSGNTTKFNFLTIDVPIHLLYNYNGFFIGAGPNFSMGVSAKGKGSGDEVDLYEDETGLGGTFKRFEMGVNGTMGFRFPNGLTLSGTGSWGLSDIFEEEDGATSSLKANNSYFGLSFGYMFGGSKAKK